jgi:hypothetical protein
MDTFVKEPSSFVVLRWLVTPCVVLFVTLATISGYRAIWQVYRVDIVASPVLHAGSHVEATIASSGRVPTTLVLQLIQGPRSDTLGVIGVRDNETASLDPRTRHGALSVVLPTSLLSQFAPGPAVLRATGLGRMQWLRVPPPKVTTRSVMIGL